MKKLLALLLVIVMVAAVFVGCTKDNQDPSNAPASSGNKQPSNEPGNPDEIVDLKWITVGNGMPENYDAWKANLDKYLEEYRTQFQAYLDANPNVLEIAKGTTEG